jgi:hypothetical protein
MFRLKSVPPTLWLSEKTDGVALLENFVGLGLVLGFQFEPQRVGHACCHVHELHVTQSQKDYR